jgi:hypothetical protein
MQKFLLREMRLQKPLLRKLRLQKFLLRELRLQKFLLRELQRKIRSSERNLFWMTRMLISGLCAKQQMI